MWNLILENALIMVFTIVFFLGGGYVFLVLLGWGLKLKSKDREQTGLTDMWIESQAQASSNGQIDGERDLKN